MTSKFRDFLDIGLPYVAGILTGMVLGVTTYRMGEEQARINCPQVYQQFYAEKCDGEKVIKYDETSLFYKLFIKNDESSKLIKKVNEESK